MTLRVVAGTIVAKNYIAYARVWARSFREHHPDARIVVLLVDRNDGAIDPSEEPFELIEAESLGLSSFREMAFRYDVMELSTAVKPAFLERLLADGREDVAIFFDPDILITAPVTPVLDALASANIVLTPHALSPIPLDGCTPTEVAFLVSGAYNLGFIGVRRSPETSRMLSWWKQRLFRGGAAAPEKGLFTDQKWIDLVPSFFEGVEILRDPTLNIAYWNLHERGEITREDGRFLVGGAPIRFFHFSGVVPDQPDVVSKHQDRYRISDLSEAARELFAHYATAIRGEGHERTRHLPYSYSTFADVEPVVPAMRRTYALAEDAGLTWRDPFEVGPGSFRDWALLRSECDNVAAPPFVRTVWQARPDLRAAFPLGLTEQSEAVIQWLIQSGADEMGIGVATRAAIRLRPLPADVESEPVEPALPPLSPPPEPAIPNRKARFWDVLFYDPTLLPDELERYSVPPGSTIMRFAEQILRPQIYRRLRFRRWCSLFEPSRANAPMETPRSAIRPVSVAEPSASSAMDVLITPVEEPFGVNLFGYLDTESGIAEVARCFVRMFEAAGVPVAPINVPQEWLRREDRSISRTATTTPFPVNLFFVNADQLPHVVDARRGILDGRKSIGYWFWELEKFPERFDPALRLLDEVWVASTFCQRSIAARAKFPVVCIPPKLESAGWPAIDRARFGLADDDVVFLTVFDAASYVRRKNPGAAIAAFKRAFPTPGRELLILKTANASQRQIEALARLGRGSRVRIVNGYASREEILALHASADACVSLHRSEGLGLTLLEAMAYGKPVVSTNYGGCEDFLHPDSARLVPYRKVRVGRVIGPYPGDAMWADPDIDAAAAHMRELADDRFGAQRLGKRAREVFDQWGSGAVELAATRIRELSEAARSS